ncbi:MAG: tetratricopeptide repeat protein [Spirochaetales bacterium]|nr:tetratricopeptide repeat protein [Spirochaetales bacterium]
MLILTAAGLVSAQSSHPSESPWSLTASPVCFLPAVSGMLETNELFAPSWGGTITAEYDLDIDFPLALRLSGHYSVAELLPVGDVPVDGTLSEMSLLVGAAAGMELSPFFTFRGFLDAGIVYGSLVAGSGLPYAAAQAGVGLDFNFNESLTARLETSAMYKFGLAGGLGTSLGVNYRLPVLSGSAGLMTPFLDFSLMNISSVFPVLRSQYDDQALGSVTIANNGKRAADDIRVSFIVKQYMDAPKVCFTIDRLEPGQSVQVPLFALFNDSILGITEATKVSGQVAVEYAGIEQTRAVTVLVYDRNALTWADDRMAAAFVSSKDPWVLDLTGNIMASVMDTRNPGLPGNMQTAVAIHEGLKAYGVSYMKSPGRPFASAVVDKAAVDSLKYPRQTLGFRAGDCADLSVLYASCFEAAGIETAFVTVPGHIFMAADIGITPGQASARGMKLEEFIVYGDKVWLPLETTMRSAGFGDAWRKGASQWRNASAADQSAFYPIHEAWTLFPPVGLPADGSAVTLPDSVVVLQGFKLELAKAVDAELAARLAMLGQSQQKGQSSDKDSNDRGVLYAKYGFYNDARRYFLKAAQEGSVSALVNLGNIAMFESDADSAYKYYQQAAKQLPRNARLKVNFAKAAASLGKMDEAAAALAEVRTLDPALADQYSMIAAASDSSGSRAAEMDNGSLLWF